MKKFYLIQILFFSLTAYSQTEKVDTILEIPVVSINSYFGDQILISAPASATVIDKQKIENNAVESLLPVFNTVSGVRMEERSPGSYRLSVRGSLLRSPFGIRNLKIYFDDFPLTDAGGNTYLNLIDHSAIDRMEILKGPDGSLFGANSGGVVLINTFKKTDAVSAAMRFGSYGLFRQNFSVNKTYKKYNYVLNQSYQESEGYREHSAMKRFFIHTAQSWKYRPKNLLRFSGFISKLAYDTPGGLTLEQFQDDPEQSRPATAFAPSAMQQRAGIYNNSLFAGLSHESKFSPALRHVISFSGMLSDYKNPFISNFEERKESSYAARTYLEWKSNSEKRINFQLNTGWEYQHTQAEIINYGNNSGQRDTIQTADRIENEQQFIFSRLAMRIGKQWKTEGSVSVNFYSFKYNSLPPFVYAGGEKKLNPELMPRLAISYLFKNGIALRGIISKGFSPPGTAELRASDAQINPYLQAEHGWNNEVGLRYNNPSGRLYIDIAAFIYRLDDAIVRRVNELDQDYFVNAGGSIQKGLEIQGRYQFRNRESGWIRGGSLNSAITLNEYLFDDYMVADMDHSGNFLSGVPKRSATTSLQLALPNDISLFLQHNYTSSIPLNDANSVYSQEYNLLRFKMTYTFNIKDIEIELHSGIDNILNEVYSPGSDINAFGGRYFNTAAPISFFAGLRLQL